MDKWDYPQESSVRRVVQCIADHCLKKSMEPNGAVIANAFGILQSEFDTLATSAPETARILQFAVAYNALTRAEPFLQEQGMVPARTRRRCLAEIRPNLEARWLHRRDRRKARGVHEGGSRMNRPLRWDRCVSHRAAEAESFVGDYFKNQDRQIGLIAGAGFDPLGTRRGVAFAGGAWTGAWPFPSGRTPLSPFRAARFGRGERSEVARLTPGAIIEKFDIFDAVDNAPVGSRRVISLLRTRLSLEGLTDLVIDCSALSAGICFSITKYCYELVPTFRRWSMQFLGNIRWARQGGYARP